MAAKAGDGAKARARARDLGIEARKTGKKRTANPYTRSTSNSTGWGQWEAWDEGWRQQAG